MNQERRVYQRLALTKPLDAHFGTYAVRLLDVSAIGALIESDADLPLGLHGPLRFTWRQHDVAIEAETVRSEQDHAALHFLEDSEPLRAAIAESATVVLRAQEANLEGERERNVISGEETLTTASAGLRLSGFVTWTLEEEGWKRRRSLLPDQPEHGFTLAASEPEEQVELLRKTYESGDAEAQRLTRLLAELSVATVRSP